jgi:TetR/AcrR family transcriptional regulator of autoinduction and epiphytic fitness
VPDAGVADGRTARSERTRDAVVDALLALLREGVLRPTASDIAARAGVSLRSVYVHFHDREDLFLAATERQVQWLARLLEPMPPPEAPLALRIETFVRVRAAINEENAPVRRAAILEASRSAALGDAQRRAGRFDRRWISEVFAPELADVAPERRDLLVAALDAATCGSAWERLRRLHRLSKVDAAAVVTSMVGAILAGRDTW